jgi:hypothetical protein
MRYKQNTQESSAIIPSYKFAPFLALPAYTRGLIFAIREKLNNPTANF